MILDGHARQPVFRIFTAPVLETHDANRHLLLILRSAPKLAQGRTVGNAAVVEQEVFPFMKPHAPAHARVIVVI